MELKIIISQHKTEKDFQHFTVQYFILWEDSGSSETPGRVF